jgi:hypothetical protein
VYIAIGISGFTALAAQVLWTRLLSLSFGATAYTFSLILGGFLFGLGIGSSLGAGIARTTDSPRAALGWCQMLLCGALAWSAYMLMASMPYWPINPQLSSDPWFNFQLDMLRCLWVVLPGAVLWGASFPLALAAVAAPGQDPGRLVGGVYAANTIGAIVGSVVSGLVLVVWLGSHTAQQVLIYMSAFSALMLLAPVVAGDSGRSRLAWGPIILLVIATTGAGRAGTAKTAGGVRAVLGDVGWAHEHHLCRGGFERLRGGVRDRRRRAQLPQRREGAGLERAAGHAAPADAGPPDASDSEESRECAGDWLRRGRDRGRREYWPAGQTHDHRGNRTAGARIGGRVLRGTQLQRRPEHAEGLDSHR